jgi:sugar fermentation stimulation protein A
VITYSQIKKAVFIDRPNRFVANVLLDGKRETVHVKNTGRCKELLVEGCEVILFESDNLSRKTKYDLVAVYKKRDEKSPLLINMDSQIPNDVADEWLRKGNLFSENAIIRREVKFGNSRFDFYVEDGARKAFLEVKGVTLENNGVAMFPDAPTERGIKHIKELMEL